jgi:hypothetical protein
MTTPTPERTEDRARARSLIQHQQERLRDLAALLVQKGDHEAAQAVAHAVAALWKAREQLE